MIVIKRVITLIILIFRRMKKRSRRTFGRRGGRLGEGELARLIR